MYMLKFTEWMELREQMIGSSAAGVSSIVKKMPGMSSFDKTKKRIDSTIKGLFLKGNTKQASKQVDTIINGEINNASTGLEDAAKLAGMRDSIKKSLSSL